MGIITLTDRIPVSVRAKNETQSNTQKRDTGKNIAKALGNENISDSLADEIGATTKPTITDEQGREWVSMADIIAAGKKMKENGAFDGPEYDDYVHNGYHYLRTNEIYMIQGGSLYIHNKFYAKSGDIFTTLKKETNGYLVSGVAYTTDGSSFVNESWFENPNTGAISQYVKNESYGDEIKGSAYRASELLEPNAYGLQTGTLTRPMIISLLNEQPVAHHGGSLIDWTKPDDEIEEDIRNLHETWDVSDHAGSTTANGTYVLSGPIEFNPGD